MRSVGRLALALALLALAPAEAVMGEQTGAPVADKPAAAKPTDAKSKAAKHKEKKRKTQAAKGGDQAAAKPAVPSAPQPAAPAPAAAPAKTAEAKPPEPKAAPHFGSLRAEKVYLRSGPSADYPIQWVYVRKGLPVEILAAFDVWRKIRDFEGTEGWVHQQMLTGRRSVLVTGAVRDLHSDPQLAAPVVAQLEPGVVAAVSHCDASWCELKAGGYRGWLKRDELWGVEPGETIE